MWRCGDLTVSALISRLSGVGLSPSQGHCAVPSSGETLYCHSASLYPREMGTSQFNAEDYFAIDYSYIPPMGKSRNTPKLLHATETGIGSGLMGHLAHI